LQCDAQNVTFALALKLSISEKTIPMKKTILLALTFLFLATSNFAQFKVGIKAGANLSKVSGQSFNDEFDLGYQVGAFSEIGFGGKLGIQPEVLFSQVNTKRSSGFNSIYQNIATPSNEDNIKLQYLSIPILLRYNVGKLVSLNLGPEFSVLINHDENLLKNGENAFKNGDFSMVGGLQLNLSRFRVYGRYNVGLNNINDIDEKEKWKNQQLQLGLGIKL
jgi:hypothetical protein